MLLLILILAGLLVVLPIVVGFLALTAALGTPPDPFPNESWLPPLASARRETHKRAAGRPRQLRLARLSRS